jgi:hypothetical protein
MSRNGVDIAALAIMLVGLAACVNARAWRDGTMLPRPDGTGRAGGVRGGRWDRSGSGRESKGELERRAEGLAVGQLPGEQSRRVHQYAHLILLLTCPSYRRSLRHRREGGTDDRPC